MSMRRASATRPAVALALGLCLALATIAQAEAAETKDRQFEIVEGRAYGVLDRQALDAVLEVYARATGMVYEVAEPLGGETITGRFDGPPAGEALVELLRGFDYTAVWRADGTIGRLKVTGLRAGYRDAGGGTVESPAPEPTVEAAMDPDVADDRDIVGFEDQEFRTDEASLANLSRAELREAVEFMDLEALAGEVGMPAEQLYLEPSGEELEPAPDLNLIRNLLQQLENQAEQHGLQQ